MVFETSEGSKVHGVYTGQFVNGCREGAGRYEDQKNKTVCHGMYVNDKMEGFGTMYEGDFVYSGMYVNDCAVGEHVSMELKPKVQGEVIVYDKKGNETKRRKLDTKG